MKSIKYIVYKVLGMPRVQQFAEEILGKDLALALTLPCESVEQFLKEYETIKCQGRYGISEQVSDPIDAFSSTISEIMSS